MSEHDDLDPQLSDLASWLDEATEPVTLGEVQSSGTAASTMAGGAAMPAAGARGEDADVLLLAPHDSGDARMHRRARSPRVLAVAAVVAAIALVGGVLALAGGGDDPTDVATDLTTIPSGSPGALTRGWERVDGALPANMQLLGTGSNGEQLIAAVADVSTCGWSNPAQCDVDRFEAWTSSSGAEWTRAGTIADDVTGGWPVVEPQSVLWNGGRWLLAGASGLRLLVWSSPDGVEWDASPLVEQRTTDAPVGIALVDGGAVAVGNVGNPDLGDVSTFTPPLAWVSSDPEGLVWDASTTQVSALPVSAGPNLDHVAGVTSIGSTVVAYGAAHALATASEDPEVTLPVEQGRSEPVIWLSLDSGQTWIQSVLAEQRGAVAHGVATEDGFVLTGTLDGRAASWSLDPSGGVRALNSPVRTDPPTTPEDPTGLVPAGLDDTTAWPIAAGPAGLVAFDAERGRFMVGDDGIEWAPVEQSDLVPAGTNVRHITAHGDGFVAFGQVGDAPTVWRWQPSTPIPPTTADTTPDTTGGTPDATAPPTTELPPTTTVEEPNARGESCIESVVAGLREMSANSDISDVDRETVLLLVDLDVFQEWDRAGVCVSYVSTADAGLVFGVLDNTLTPELEASTIAAVPEGVLWIQRINRAEPPVTACVESVEAQLQSAHDDGDGFPAPRQAVADLLESGVAAAWDDAGVCVLRVELNDEHLVVSVIDATLPDDLDRQATDAAPDLVLAYFAPQE